MTSLKEIFNNVYLEVKKHESLDIHYIQDKLKVLLDVDENKRFIKFSVVVGTNTSKSELEILKALNLSNYEYLMFQTSCDDNNTAYVRYYLWIEGGVIPKNIIKTYQSFNKIMLSMIIELNEKGIIL